MSILKKAAVAAALLAAATASFAADNLMTFTNQTSDTTFTPHCIVDKRILPELIVLSPNSSKSLDWYTAQWLLHIPEGKPVDCAIRDDKNNVFYHAKLTVTSYDNNNKTVTLSHDTDATPYSVTITPDSGESAHHFEAIIDHKA